MTTRRLEARELSFSYGASHVFTHWSAELHAGVTWLQGPNGSGKSTLLKLLAGALEPFTGRRVAVGIDAEFDALADPLGYRRHVFWCGPGAPVFDHLRAPEFFAFMAGLYPRWADAALADAVQGLQLAPFLLPRIAQLSSGNQRKVWLAAALAVGTPVVLLDEPFNALDAASLAWLHRVLRHHAQTAAQAQAQTAAQAWLVASHDEPVPGGPQRVLRLALP